MRLERWNTSRAGRARTRSAPNATTSTFEPLVVAVRLCRGRRRCGTGARRSKSRRMRHTAFQSPLLSDRAQFRKGASMRPAALSQSANTRQLRALAPPSTLGLHRGGRMLLLTTAPAELSLHCSRCGQPVRLRLVPGRMKRACHIDAPIMDVPKVRDGQSRRASRSYRQHCSGESAAGALMRFVGGRSLGHGDTARIWCHHAADSLRALSPPDDALPADWRGCQKENAGRSPWRVRTVIAGHDRTASS
jgi:hypothetical protein